MKIQKQMYKKGKKNFLPDNITKNSKFADTVSQHRFHARAHHVVLYDRRGYSIHQNIGTSFIRILK